VFVGSIYVLTTRPTFQVGPFFLPARMNRSTSVSDSWFVSTTFIGLHFGVHAAIGPPLYWQRLDLDSLLHGKLNITGYCDVDGVHICNATFTGRPSINTLGNVLVFLGFFFVPAIGWWFKKRIFGWLTRPLYQRMRLNDGAFIAALLDDDSSDQNARRKRDLVSEAASLIRRVGMSNVTLEMLSASPRDPDYDASEAYKLSESCGLGGAVDFFVSHSWSDCPKQKYAALCAVTLLFLRRHRRQPTFWLDKSCIDQQDIERTLRCLPVMVQSCSQLLILAGDSYVNRLWCVLELYVHFAMSAGEGAEHTTFANCRRPAQEAARLQQLKSSLQAATTDVEALAALASATLANERTETPDAHNSSTDISGSARAETEEAVEAGGIADLLTFNVRDAHCFSAADEAKLRRVIESESSERFNAAIREAGVLLATARHSSTANPLSGGSSPVESGGRGAVQQDCGFAELDTNSDGRLDSTELLTAFGGTLSAQQVRIQPTALRLLQTSGT
jgi:hypothetical protein